MTKSKCWLTVALSLSLLAIASSIYLAALVQGKHRVQIERIKQRQAVYDEHARQLEAWRARDQRRITSALDDYRADAYDPGIERIAEQQLIAAEYELLLLQTIALQNTVMIELMLIWP